MSNISQFHINNIQTLLDNWIGLDQFLLPTPQKPSFPPYDIIRDGDTYSIVVALAGYKVNDITITHQDNKLIVESYKPSTSDDKVVKDYLHKGIAKRAFKLPFNLSPELVIDGSTLINGMLTINMHRVIPDTKSPKTITIVSE